MANAVDDHGDAYRDAIGSIVWITTYDHSWNPSYGTGIVVEGGDILTARHVIEDGPSVVTFPEYDKEGGIIADSADYMADKGRLLPCTIVAEDRRRDLALLRLIAARPGPTDPDGGEGPISRPVGLHHRQCGPSGRLFRFAAGHVRLVCVEG